MDRPRPSIRDFLTDGSLAALCRALSAMSGAQVSLHDERGRRIVHTGGSPAWHVEEADGRSQSLAAELERLSREGVSKGPGRLGEGVFVQPLWVARVTVGALVIEGAEDSRLREVVGLLASAVDELFEADIEVTLRNAELDTLVRLSSLLVAARDVQAVLDVALQSAMSMLRFDAGVVHLLDDDGASMRLRASAGVDEAFRERYAALRSAADGEFEAPQWPARFAGAVSCELMFKGRRIGVMRLYSLREAPPEPKEHALLQTITEQVATAVASARLIETERQARQVQRQLRLAADVQRRLLPAQAPVIRGLDIAARYIPSLELAGDFYDLIDLGGHLGLAMGDVAGKGAPAAILMASVRATLRAHAPEVYHLDEIITRVNKALTRDTLPNEFATLFYGVIDPRTLRLTYCSAGHDPTYLLRLPEGRAPEARDLHVLDTGGTVIGIDANQKYERGMFDLAPGDTLVAYTDGIVDARNFEGKKFGRDTLRRVILDVVGGDRGCSAQKVADHIVWEVRRFIGLNPAIDDMTVLVVRVMGGSH
jgi:serine phosphatase RsbU (regulator of sigma subunit)